MKPNVFDSLCEENPSDQKTASVPDSTHTSVRRLFDVCIFFDCMLTCNTSRDDLMI